MAESSIVLPVNTFDATTQEWSPTGTSPYIDAQDHPANFIEAASKKAASSYYGFEDSSSLGVINSINLEIYGEGSSALQVHDLDVSGQAYQFTLTTGGQGWCTVNITTLADWTAITNASISIVHENDAAGATVDAARLVVYYTAQVQQETVDVYMDVVSGNLENIYNDSSSYYNMLHNIFTESVFIHNLLENISNTNESTYGMRENIYNSLEENHTLMSFVNATSTVIHNLQLNVFNLFSFNYLLRSMVYNTLESLYNIIGVQLVDKLLTVTFGLKAYVSNTSEFLHGLKENIYNSLISSYLLRMFVSNETTLASSLKENIGKLFGSIYSFIVGGTVNKTLSLAYGIKQYIVKLFSPLYHLRVNILKQFISVDNLMENISNTLSSNYLLREKIYKVFLLVYSFIVAGLINTTFSMIHGLRENKSNILSLGYKFRSFVSNSFSATYGLLQYIYKSISMVYSFPSAVITALANVPTLIRTKTLMEAVKTKTESIIKKSIRRTSS